MHYTHDQHTAKALGIVALVCICLLTLTGCTSAFYPSTEAPHETKKEMNAQITKDMEAMDREKNSENNPQPADFESIVDALGCMFDPNDCPLKKSKEEQKMDR